MFSCYLLLETLTSVSLRQSDNCVYELSIRTSLVYICEDWVRIPGLQVGFYGPIWTFWNVFQYITLHCVALYCNFQ